MHYYPVIGRATSQRSRHANVRGGRFDRVTSDPTPRVSFCDQGLHYYPVIGRATSQLIWSWSPLSREIVREQTFGRSVSWMPFRSSDPRCGAKHRGLHYYPVIAGVDKSTARKLKAEQVYSPHSQDQDRRVATAFGWVARCFGQAARVPRRRTQRLAILPGYSRVYKSKARRLNLSGS